MTTKPIAMRDALLDRIHAAMGSNAKVFFISADFGSPVLDRIRQDFPERFINVGIAEQNLINVSAGLALEGYTVFAYAIAPFITMRCYEQIRVSLALMSRVRTINVNLIGVGAGYSYVVSGPTHQCYEDITLMRAMPNFQIYSPADHITAAALCESCIAHTGPKYLRLDAQVLPVIHESGVPDLKTGFRVVRPGEDICLIATGYMLHTALLVAEELAAMGLEPGVIDIFDITGFDAARLAAEISSYRGIISLEEGFHGRGGLDSMLFEFIARRRIPVSMLNIGVEGAYRFELGSRIQLHEKVGIGPEAVRQKAVAFIQSLSNTRMDRHDEISSDA
jgi:transketolase